jgi:hypothetical protein
VYGLPRAILTIAFIRVILDQSEIAIAVQNPRRQFLASREKIFQSLSSYSSQGGITFL